jgi:hypothetical protein
MAFELTNLTGLNIANGLSVFFYRVSGLFRGRKAKTK